MVEITPITVLVEKDGIQNRQYNKIVYEGIKIWILLKTMSDLDPNFDEGLKNYIGKEADVNTNSAISYFSERVRSIEILNNVGNI